MTVLTAETLRDELRRCTDDFVLQVRTALRRELEQSLNVDDIKQKTSSRFQSLTMRKTMSDRTSGLPIVHTTSNPRLMPRRTESNLNSSVHFGARSEFLQTDALDNQFTAALEPKVLHWKKSTSAATLGSRSWNIVDSSDFAKPSAGSEDVKLPSDSRITPRTTGKKPADVAAPFNSTGGRNSWRKRHNTSFRQLALAQENIQSTPDSAHTYQLVPMGGEDKVDLESELAAKMQRPSTRQRGSGVDFDQPTLSRRSAVGFTEVKTTTGGRSSGDQRFMKRTSEKGEFKKPRKTMQRDSENTDGWMHRFRKGKFGAGSTHSDADSLIHEFSGHIEEDDFDEDDDRRSICRTYFDNLLEYFTYVLFGVSCLEDLVSSNRFNAVSGALVIGNAVSIGIQTDYMAVHWCQDVPYGFRISEKIFCAFFMTELALRICAYGCRFFYGPGWRWNLFDGAMVAFQLTEVLLEPANTVEGSPALNHWSSFRMLRLVRIIRLARILHLISELRMLVVSISHSIRSLGWVVLLLLVMIYVLAVYLTQIVTDHKVTKVEPVEDEEVLLHFYGSLDRSVLSLYAMVSEGIHWDTLMDPLAEHISPWLRLVFFFFSAFAIFAVMNVVTGVFVESALTTATEDRKVSITAQMKDLFERVDDDGSGDITWDEFQEHLLHPQMQACLKEIDVNNDDAHELFRLLDINNSGTIDIDELVHGCLRLMGWAKAIDLATFMNEYRIVTLRWARHARYMEECLDLVMEKVDYLLDLDPAFGIAERVDEEDEDQVETSASTGVWASANRTSNYSPV